MTWATTYFNRLAQLRSVAGPPERQSALDTAYRVLATKTKMMDYSKMGSPTGSNGKDFSPGNIASGTWSAAKASLNFIERPFYAIEGATKAAMDDPNNKGQSPWLRALMSGSGLGLAANIATQPGAFGRGLSGQDHTTTSDITNKYVPGINDWNPVARFALNMGGDVLADPLSYIGPGAIKALWKGGFKVAGKAGLGSGVAPKLARATNTTIAALPETKPQALIPSSLIKKDLAATGHATTGDAAANKFLDRYKRQEARNQPQPPKITPYDVTYSDQSKGFYDAIKNVESGDGRPLSNLRNPLLRESATNPKIIPPKRTASLLPYVNQPVQSAAELADHATLNAVSKGFSGIGTKAHPKGFKIDPIYVPDTSKVASEVTKATKAAKVTTELPKTPVGKATTSTIDEILAPVLGGKDHTFLFEATGKKPAIGAKGGRISISKERLIGLIKTGKVSDNSAYTIRLGVNDSGKAIPLSKFVKDAHKATKTSATSATSAFEAEVAAKAVSGGTEGAAKGGKAAEQAAVPATEDAVRRLNPVERAQWLVNHQHLTKAERNKILRNNNPDRAAKAIAEIKAAHESGINYGEIKSFFDLEVAISSGVIDPKDPVFQEALQKIISATGTKGKGKAGITAASNKIAKILERQAKAAGAKGAPTTDSLKVTADSIKEHFAQRLNSLVDNPVADAVKAKVISTKDLTTGVLRYGNTAVFDKTKIVLDQAQHEAVQRVMQRGAESQIRDPLNKWLYRTDKNVPRTSPIPGIGDAKRPAMNMGSQYTIGKDLLNEAIKLLPPKISGPAREVELYNQFMPMLHASEQMLRQSGLPIILGYGEKGIPLSLHDIFSALPKQMVQHYFFNKSSAIDVSQFGRITQQLIRLSKKEITPLQFDEVTSKILHAPRNLKVETAKGGPQLSNYAAMKKFVGKDSIKKATDQYVAESFKSAAVNIMQALTRNSAEALVEVGAHAQKLTDAAMQRFAKVILDDHAMPSDIIGVVTNPAKLIDEAAVGVGEAVSADAKDLAKIQLEIRMAEVIDGSGIHVAAKGVEKYAALTHPMSKVRARTGWKESLSASKAAIATDIFKAADYEAAQIMKDAGYAVTDLGMRAEFANYVASVRAFFPHIGNEALRPDLLGYRNLAKREAEKYTIQLSKLAKDSTVEQQVEAFRYLQKDATATIKDPAIAQLADDISKMWNQVLGDTHEKFGFIGRNGISGEELAAKFEHYGVDAKEFPLDYADVANSWKKWDVKDPLSAASKIHAAAQAVIGDKVLGASFTMNFGEKVWKPGLVKILNTGDRSRIAKLIDTSQFYPKDIAQQMHLIDKTLEEFAKKGTSSKFLRNLDSILHSYKAGLTIYNLGHHVRNMTGDIWLSYMDGMTNPKYYARGHVIMATRNASHQGMDAIAAAKASGVQDVTKSQSHVIYKGKRIDLSPAQEYDLGYNVGMYPGYSILEDIQGTIASGDLVTGLRTRSPFKGNIQKVAAGVSEYRDHWVRASQFNWLIDGLVLDGKKPLDEALRMAAEKAGARVRKTHPDGSDLSQMERTVMRRSVLFYSWIRKAIPLVATGMVQRPGRFMMYPKATYNLAEAQGIDLKSFGDQFPTDQLFPGWMEDGTQGVMAGGPNNYWQSKPGIPSADVMDQYGTNPLGTLRTIMGSTNPALRIPYEMASGNSVGTGSKIKDKSEYVDSQLPFAGFIDKITGRSLSSGFSQPLSVAKSNENYVPTVPVWLQQFLNKNLGAGVTDMSKPSYIKQGQFAKRDAAAQTARAGG